MYELNITLIHHGLVEALHIFVICHHWFRQWHSVRWIYVIHVYNGTMMQSNHTHYIPVTHTHHFVNIQRVPKLQLSMWKVCFLIILEQQISSPYFIVRRAMVAVKPTDFNTCNENKAVDINSNTEPGHSAWCHDSNIMNNKLYRPLMVTLMGQRCVVLHRYKNACMKYGGIKFNSYNIT